MFVSPEKRETQPPSNVSLVMYQSASQQKTHAETFT